MIKSFHKLLVPRREQEYRALVAFFDALGMEHGYSWSGRRSQGMKLEAPEAGVEIGMGQGFPDADLVIEVSSADEAYQAASQGGLKVAEEIADTDWGARMFTLEAPAGAGRVAVFSYNEDWRKKPIAGEGSLKADKLRFGVVVARFNAFITERLLAGALDGLRRCGAEEENIQVVRVPGSFEIPAAARALAESGKVDAVICLGCLLRGETLHYEVIATEVTRGIGQSAQETGVPHAFGVLTCDTLEQAIDRAGLKSGNKGFEAALSAVEMGNLAVSHRPSAVGKKKRADTRGSRESSKGNRAVGHRPSAIGKKK